MFTHRFRYLFILALSVYTYLNTVLCEVYKYFNIDIEWYYAFGTITAITLGIWEASRLLQPYFNRLISDRKNKIKTLIIFFAAGSVLTTILTTAIVFAVSMLLHRHTVAEPLCYKKTGV